MTFLLSLSAQGATKPGIIQKVESRGILSKSPENAVSIQENPDFENYLIEAYAKKAFPAPSSEVLASYHRKIDEAQSQIDELNASRIKTGRTRETSRRRLIFKGVFFKQFDLYIPEAFQGNARVMEAYRAAIGSAVQEVYPQIAGCHPLPQNAPRPGVICAVPRIYAISFNHERKPLIHALWLRDRDSRSKRGSLACNTLANCSGKGVRARELNLISIRIKEKVQKSLIDPVDTSTVSGPVADRLHEFAVSEAIRHVQIDLDERTNEETLARKDLDQLRDLFNEYSTTETKKWADQFETVNTQLLKLREENSPEKIQSELIELIRKLEERRLTILSTDDQLKIQIELAEKQRLQIIDQMREREKDMIFGIIKESVVGISIDTSGSIDSNQCPPYSSCAEYAQEQLILVLRILKPEQKINIIFTNESGSCTSMFPQAVYATLENVEEAIRQLKHGRSRGAVSIPCDPQGETLEPIFRVMAADQVQRIYAFTDGDWSITNSVAARNSNPGVSLTIKKLLSDSSFYQVGNLRAHLTQEKDAYLPSGTAEIPADIIALMEKSASIYQTILELRKIQTENTTQIEAIQKQIDQLNRRLEESKTRDPNSPFMVQQAEFEAQIRAILDSQKRTETEIARQANILKQNEEDLARMARDRKKLLEERQALEAELERGRQKAAENAARASKSKSAKKR